MKSGALWYEEATQQERVPLQVIYDSCKRFFQIASFDFYLQPLIPITVAFLDEDLSIFQNPLKFHGGWNPIRRIPGHLWAV
jgi:hypothetical protein